MSMIKKLLEKIFKRQEYTIFLKLGYLLLGSLFFPTFVSSLFLILNISINIINFIIGLILLFISYYYLFYDKKNKKEFFIPIIISIIIYLICLGTTYSLYDRSSDGMFYHLPAVLKLSEGWNPLYEHFDNQNILVIWSEHYPKFIWIYGAMLYQITNNIYSATIFNHIVTIASLFITFDIIYKITNKKTLSIISSIIITFNVVLVGQLFTMYNDGVLGLCIISIILIYLAITKDIYSLKKSFNPITIILAGDLSLLCNIKYTGALFAFLLFIIYTIICYWKKKILLDKKFISYLLIIGLGVSIISSNTYLPNLIYHKNIGYPIMGKNKIEIIDQFVPEYINGNSKIIAFIKSQTHNTYYKEYVYEPPFTLNYGDYLCSSSYDCRDRGFSPLFQLIMISITIIVIYELIKIIINKNTKKEFNKFIKKYQIELISFGVMFLFFIITPATWWSRYIPYIYTIPILIIILFNIDLRKLNITSYLTITIIIIYSVTLVINYRINLLKTIEYTNEYKNELLVLKNESKNNHIDIETIDKVNQGKDVVLNNELTKRGIDYTRNNYNNCKIKQELSYLDINLLDCSKER